MGILLRQESCNTKHKPGTRTLPLISVYQTHSRVKNMYLGMHLCIERQQQTFCMYEVEHENMNDLFMSLFRQKGYIYISSFFYSSI